MEFDYSVCKDVAVTTLESERIYHTPDGDFPSVTTILRATDDDSWLAAALGRQLVGDLENALKALKDDSEVRCLVAGWRIYGFDLPYIEARSALHGIAHDRPWWPGASAKKWEMFDLAEYVQRFPGPNYKPDPCYWPV